MSVTHETVSIASQGLSAEISALGAEMVARGRTPSHLDLPADSSMPVDQVSA